MRTNNSSLPEDGKAQEHTSLILQRDHILRDILEHIDGLINHTHRLHDVDTKPLKDEVIRPVLDGKFDPEVQIRGFLRALRRTTAFKQSLEKIDSPSLKEDIIAFMDGKSAGDALDGKVFVLPASKKHGAVGRPKFGKQEKEVESHSIVDRVKQVVLKLLHVKALFTSCFGKEKAVDRDLPRIFEDKGQTKTVEVSPLFNFYGFEYTFVFRLGHMCVRNLT